MKRDAPLFRLRDGKAPTVSELKGFHITQLQLREDAPSGPMLSLSGLCKTVRRRHIQIIKDMRLMDGPMLEMPLGAALVEMITRMKEKRKWRWSTLLTYMSSLEGALMQLPAYTDHPWEIRIDQDPMWRIAMRGANIKAREEYPKAPCPITTAEFKYAVDLLWSQGKKPQAFLLWLAWYTASRMGDALQLKWEDIDLKTNGEMVISFRRGKGVRMRGPYSVHSQGQYRLEEMVDLYRRRNGDSWVATAATHMEMENLKQEIRAALRCANPGLELRSVRRGSLQTMSAQGTSEATLILFSGHTNVAMLRRYLGFGKVARKETMEAVHAAIYLQ
jgi:integrase